MLLNPPSHLLNLKVDLVSYVIGCKNSQNESRRYPPPVLKTFAVGLLSLDPSTMIGTPIITLQVVILLPSFAARFPSASCTIHFHCT